LDLELSVSKAMSLASISSGVRCRPSEAMRRPNA
jgi:hypothetical protein